MPSRLRRRSRQRSSRDANVDADDDVVDQPALAAKPSHHPTLFELRPRWEGQDKECLHRRLNQAHQRASKSRARADQVSSER